MQYLYIDESGSMTDQYVKNWPYFIIAIVRTENPKKLKTLRKRFIKKYMDELKRADTGGKMFKDGVFKELKGSAFTPDLKCKFSDYFFREGTMDIFFIAINNKNMSHDPYKNKARAFNYILKSALEYFIKSGKLPDDEYFIQLDERNEKSDAKHFLQNYLNTELRMEQVLSKDIRVQYFDSAENFIIQLADVLANLYLSYLWTDSYKDQIYQMVESGCLKFEFKFPLI